MKNAICSLILVACTAMPLPAQDTREIRRGESIPGTLTADIPHRFAIDLDERTFVYGAVEQRTVDVVVRIFDPTGDVMRTFDSPARGPERFTFDTEAAGRYVIEVSSFENGAGDYSIAVLSAERVATDPRRRVDQLLAAFADDATPGAVVGVVEDGELAFTRAYGMANLSYGVRFDNETISNIGSVTKQFTAMGLLLLQDEGKLSLEDDIREHVPELPDFGEHISLRNLLNHTGGFREIYHLMGMTGYNAEDDLSRERAIEIVQRQPELQAPPNTEYRYNNTGYILLATTIERVTGMTFPEYMKARVFEPLGMTDTRVKAYQGEVIPGSAQGYLPADGGGYRSVRDLAASYGAGGIYTTVADLAKWMLNYRDHGLGGTAAFDAMTRNTVLESGDSTGYGLGLGLTRFRGRTIYRHTGGDVAHRAYFGYYPELESGVIVMSNNGSFNLGVATDIALAFFADRFEPEVEPDVVAADDAMSEDRLAAITGAWRINGPNASLDIVYSVADGDLYAQATGQPRFKVLPTSDSTATFDGVPATVTFHFADDGTVDRATHHQGPAMPMTRIDEREAPELGQLVGRYYSEELETLFEVRLEDGALAAHNIRMADPIALTHEEGDRFSGSTVFFATVEFIRAGNGRVTGFMGSNARNVNIWFRRQ